MPNILHYGARLAEARKKKMNNSDFQLFQVCHFKGARIYCIINKGDQLAAKECNRKWYYGQKLEKLLLCVREWDFDCTGPFYHMCSKK